MQAQETSFIFKTCNADKKKSQIDVWSLLFSTSYSYCLFRNAVRGPFSAVREQSLCSSQPKPRELGSSCRKQFWGVAGAEMTAAQAAGDRAPQHTQSRRSAQTAPVPAGRGAGPPFLFSARYHSLINSTGTSVLLLRGKKRNCSPDPTYSAFSFANLSPLSCALAPHGGQADTWGGRACRTQLPARGASSARTGAGAGLPGAAGPGAAGAGGPRAGGRGRPAFRRAGPGGASGAAGEGRGEGRSCHVLGGERRAGSAARASAPRVAAERGSCRRPALRTLLLSRRCPALPVPREDATPSKGAWRLRSRPLSRERPVGAGGAGKGAAGSAVTGHGASPRCPGGAAGSGMGSRAGQLPADLGSERSVPRPGCRG